MLKRLIQCVFLIYMPSYTYANINDYMRIVPDPAASRKIGTCYNQDGKIVNPEDIGKPPKFSSYGRVVVYCLDGETMIALDGQKAQEDAALDALSAKGQITKLGKDGQPYNEIVGTSKSAQVTGELKAQLQMQNCMDKLYFQKSNAKLFSGISFSASINRPKYFINTNPTYPSDRTGLKLEKGKVVENDKGSRFYSNGLILQLPLTGVHPCKNPEATLAQIQLARDKAAQLLGKTPQSDDFKRIKKNAENIYEFNLNDKNEIENLVQYEKGVIEDEIKGKNIQPELSKIDSNATVKKEITANRFPFNKDKMCIQILDKCMNAHDLYEAGICCHVDKGCKPSEAIESKLDNAYGDESISNEISESLTKLMYVARNHELLQRYGISSEYSAEYRESAQVDEKEDLSARLSQLNNLAINTDIEYVQTVDGKFIPRKLPDGCRIKFSEHSYTRNSGKDFKTTRYIEPNVDCVRTNRAKARYLDYANKGPENALDNYFNCELYTDRKPRKIKRKIKEAAKQDEEFIREHLNNSKKHKSAK